MLTPQLEAEREGLLRDVIENPADDAPRLIYHDWREERGVCADAGYDRAQVRAVRCQFAYWPQGFMAGERLWLHGECRLGFVEAVSIPVSLWLEHGPALVRAHPLTRVELSDRDCGEPSGPYDFVPDAVWWHFASPDLALWPGGGTTSHWLPLRLAAPAFWPGCDHRGSRVRFRTRKEAEDALSAACLAWARAENARRRPSPHAP
jgi:uncharacterized protein (TIGR02996 family)